MSYTTNGMQTLIRHSGAFPTASEHGLQASAGVMAFAVGEMEGGLLPHLGRAARDHRRRAKLKLVRVAYSLNKAEATMSRFERGEVQPNDLDRVVAAYAREVGVEPIDIWADAMERWRRA